MRRNEIPALMAVLIILALMLLSVSARAEPLQEAVVQAAQQAAEDVATPGWLSFGGNLTVAGMLWYYLRRLYDDKVKLETALLSLTERYAVCMANIESALRELRSDLRDDHRRPTNRVDRPPQV